MTLLSRAITLHLHKVHFALFCALLKKSWLNWLWTFTSLSSSQLRLRCVLRVLFVNEPDKLLSRVVNRIETINHCELTHCHLHIWLVPAVSELLISFSPTQKSVCSFFSSFEIIINYFFTCQMMNCCVERKIAREQFAHRTQSIDNDDLVDFESGN